MCCASSAARAISVSAVAGIAELLALWRDQGRASADVKGIALAHVAELERKIAQLQGMADTLRTLAAHCHGDARPDCPILTDLDAGGGR
jgi:MerR family copper efflux transcriptional regulator